MNPNEPHDDDPFPDPAFSDPLDRGLGDVEFASNRMRVRFSDSQQEAANNLLRKARRSLRAGDDERARAFVAKALKLPFDEHEGIVPAAWDAYMELFLLVTDLLGVNGVDDDWWLAIVIPVFEASDEPARYALRDVLKSIVFDYDLPHADKRRIRKTVADVPDRGELSDLGLSDAQLRVEIMSIMRAHRRIETDADVQFD